MLAPILRPPPPASAPCMCEHTFILRRGPGYQLQCNLSIFIDIYIFHSLTTFFKFIWSYKMAIVTWYNQGIKAYCITDKLLIHWYLSHVVLLICLFLATIWLHLQLNDLTDDTLFLGVTYSSKTEHLSMPCCEGLPLIVQPDVVKSLGPTNLSLYSHVFVEHNHNCLWTTSFVKNDSNVSLDIIMCSNVRV